MGGRTTVGLAAVGLVLAAALPATAADDPHSAHCHGRARLLHEEGAAHFRFSCDGNNWDPTGFRIRTNRRLKSVSDPLGVYACQRHSLHSFDCEDVHSGAPSTARARLRVSDGACEPDLKIRIKPRLNFDGYGKPFVLAGPC